MRRPIAERGTCCGRRSRPTAPFHLSSSRKPSGWQLRESADYDALVVGRDDAERAVDAAERFLAALDDVLER
jgi:hypothetical protein